MLVSSFIKPKIVEKIIRKNGCLICVKAAVINYDGKTYFRILSAKPVRQLSGNARESQVLLLENNEEQRHDTISPFYSRCKSKLVLNSFDFFTSQMTRAPSFS